MQRNKVHSVRTISLVASELGETEEWLHEIAEEMDTEDGLIWAYSPENPDGIIAFSNDGVRSLLELLPSIEPPNSARCGLPRTVTSERRHRSDKKILDQADSPVMIEPPK